MQISVHQHLYIFIYIFMYIIHMCKETGAKKKHEALAINQRVHVTIREVKKKTKT